jgi:hypothetical protein
MGTDMRLQIDWPSSIVWHVAENQRSKNEYRHRQRALSYRLKSPPKLNKHGAAMIIIQTITPKIYK